MCSTGRRSTYVAYLTEQACEQVTSDPGPSGGLRHLCHDLCALRGDVLIMLLILLSRACENVTSDLDLRPSGGLRQMCHDMCALRGDVLLMLLILLSRHARESFQ